jgi:DNA (cytosine-5)-methyltransferase 1
VTTPDLFGDQLPQPMTMASALGWGLPDRPAWTVTAGGTETGGAEVFGNARNRARLREVVWAARRPATTVCGDPRIASPGHRDRQGGEPQFGGDAVTVSVEEAAVLQSFPPAYPWYGTKGQQHQQVGNAVPPLLAAAILRPLIRKSAGEVAA